MRRARPDWVLNRLDKQKRLQRTSPAGETVPSVPPCRPAPSYWCYAELSFPSEVFVKRLGIIQMEAKKYNTLCVCD